MKFCTIYLPFLIIMIYLISLDLEYVGVGFQITRLPVYNTQRTT